jgi:hypothetical protein
MASELPVMSFLRLETPTSGQSRQTKAAVLLIDKRDGRQVFEQAELYQGRIFSITGDRSRATVTLRLPMRNGVWSLQFTNTPRPPEPPAGHGMLGGERRSFSRIAAAAFGALVRQAEQWSEADANQGNIDVPLDELQEGGDEDLFDE